MDSLVRIHGEEIAKRSLAWKMLDSRRERLVNACIADLLGDTCRAKGIRCMCPRHPENQGQAIDVSTPFPGLKLPLRFAAPENCSEGVIPRDPKPAHHKIDGKAAASGEKEDE